MSLMDSVRAGEPLALARLLTQVENETLEGLRALDELFPHNGQQSRISHVTSTFG